VSKHLSGCMNVSVRLSECVCGDVSKHLSGCVNVSVRLSACVCGGMCRSI